MAWGAAIAAVAALGGAMAAARDGGEAQNEQRRRYEAMRKDLAPFTMRDLAPPYPGKCPCCGSHEYREHDGLTICAYCRTPSP